MDRTDDGGFQFTRARGARRGRFSKDSRVTWFQFTRARGARLFQCGDAPLYGGFNSRAHGARDITAGGTARDTAFQFTRARGARPRTDPLPYIAGILFQFTRARGARQDTPVELPLEAFRFNSRAHGARDSFRSAGSRARSCFNSRAHGARDSSASVKPGWHDVSIHARTGRATGLGTYRPGRYLFQFTRARGARLNTAKPAAIGRSFQFTRARGARPDVPRQGRQGTSCFNSRAHGARDRPVRDYSTSLSVSIHARTGRATKKPDEWRGMGGFNSRAHGARDWKNKVPFLKALQFQFTRARGARPFADPEDDEEEVSIHARTGRATPGRASRARCTCFNSRAHGARDRRASLLPQPQQGFNSRAHGARDSPGSTANRSHLRFNSRAHGARDSGRTARGALRSCFNSRAHGARDSTSTCPVTPAMFQFTRARGARPSWRRAWTRSRCFNSRAHGARDKCRGGERTNHGVSIHARTGRATSVATPFIVEHRFQFTRARGARLADRRIYVPYGRTFQFTRARGARRQASPSTSRRAVSIHARTGRATRTRGRRTGGRRFNSRAHGARDRVAYWWQQEAVFQFTRARGARQWWSGFIVLAIDNRMFIRPHTGPFRS